MASLTLQPVHFPETETDWDQLNIKMAGRFVIDQVNPHWPDRGATLDRYNRGRVEDWATAKQRWCDYAMAFHFCPLGSDGFETRLMHGTLQLHMDVLQAAHKRLFGDYTDAPSEMAIRAIGFALFNPPEEEFDLKRRRSWEQVCRYANNDHSKRIRVKAALEDLLTELDS